MLPDRLYAGTSWEVTYCLAGYLPSDGWASKVVLRGKDSHGVISLDAVAEGEGFKVSAGAGVTGDWVPGEYAAFVYAVKGDEKLIVTTETVHVLPNPEGPEVVGALRAELKAVDAAIAGVLAGEGVQSYTFETAVGRRSAERMSLADPRAAAPKTT